MNSTELSAKVLTQLAIDNAGFVPPKLSEKQKRNAGNVMQEIPLQRLQAVGKKLVRQRGLRYQWGDGIILNRNSRVGDTFWTNMPPVQLDELKKLAASNPSIFLFCYFAISQSKLHVWAIPDDIAIQTIAKIPINKSDSRTIIIDPDVHRICQVNDSPHLLQFYRELTLTTAELDALAAGIKQDAIFQYSRRGTTVSIWVRVWELLREVYRQFEFSHLSSPHGSQGILRVRDR